MKDQYVGDVNVYVKYGFLRALSAARAGPLVVCWMLTPSDEGPDGGKVGYLEQPERYRDGDTDRARSAHARSPGAARGRV